MFCGWTRDAGLRLSALGRGVMVLAVAAVSIWLIAPAGAAAALPPGCAQSGGSVTCTFSETGGAQSWTVPSGVTAASFVVDGAAGGPSFGNSGPGGLGGQVSATIGSLTAGQVLAIEVGGEGSLDGPGGFNGGGPASSEGGSGGGFSSVSLGSTVELVAGGGGGGGEFGIGNGSCGAGVAGAAGGDGGQSGEDGAPGASFSCLTETLGGGGGGNAGGDAVNPGAGGAAGVPSGTPIVNGCGSAAGYSSGSQGASSSGSAGGAGVAGGSEFFGSGGGGGGFVGGGGGGSAGVDSCGGHGGQGGGGGGSSYAAVSGAAFGTGVQSGDGQVTITYNLPQTSLSSTALAFGSQQVGTVSAAQAVTVTDAVPGTSLSVGAVTLTGLDADQFKIAYDGCSGQTLAAGASCLVSIRYVPGAVGAASASVQVTSDSLSSRDIVALSGNGTAPASPLQGPPGPQGNPGTNGTNGTNGATGATGATGLTGATGATGATGPTGPAGAAGAAAPQLTGESSSCTTTPTKTGSVTSCTYSFTYASATATAASVRATTMVAGHVRLIGRGRIAHHKLTLTLRHLRLRRGHYRITVLARIHHKQVVIGHTSLNIS